jgi:hypothetical protein
MRAAVSRHWAVQVGGCGCGSQQPVAGGCWRACGGKLNLGWSAGVAAAPVSLTSWMGCAAAGRQAGRRQQCTGIEAARLREEASEPLCERVSLCDHTPPHTSQPRWSGDGWQGTVMVCSQGAGSNPWGRRRL